MKETHSDPAAMLRYEVREEERERGRREREEKRLTLILQPC